MAKWIVLVEQPVGRVDARDRETAERLAVERWGAEARVQSEASAAIDAAERTRHRK
jgi:hypothetical protein